MSSALTTPATNASETNTPKPTVTNTPPALSTNSVPEPSPTTSGYVGEDDTYVIHGPKSPIPLSKDTLGRYIYTRLSKAPKDSVFIIDAFSHEKMLNIELLQKSINLAEALRRTGYDGQESLLAISSENNLYFFIPVLASLYNCSITVPLNHTYTTYELEHTLEITKPRIIFCAQALVNKYLDMKRNKASHIEKIIIIDQTDSENESEEENVTTLDHFISDILKGENIDVETFEPVDADSSKTIGFIMCSSGTTGLPKGVMLSHENFMVRLTHSTDPLYHPQSDGHNVLIPIPFFHCFGMIMCLGAISNIQTVIIIKRFDPDVFLKAIQDYKIDTLSLAPPLVLFLAKTDKLDKYDVSSVKDILCGAAPLSQVVAEAVHKRLKCNRIRQGFGMTETTLAVTLTHVGDYKAGSCGHVLSFVSFKIRDPETGRSLPANEVGELCFKGKLLMMGYYKNEAATKDTMTSDGWLKTGDLGYYDDEGYIFIVDRLKELIKYKGFQVAPAELESLIHDHPKVADVGVVGLPDDEAGEKPLAFVVKKPDVDELTEDEIKTHVAKVVSSQKRLTGGVIFVDSIPKNPSGKILRKDLRKMLQDLKPIKE